MVRNTASSGIVEVDPPQIPHFDFTDSKAFIVLSVRDGDSISIIRNDTIERIDLIGVDAPELRSNDSNAGDFYADEANQFVNNALKAESVYLRFEPEGDGNNNQPPRAYVFRAPDGLWLNLEVVRQGYGQLARDELAAHAELFEAYQDRAMEAKKGLWNAKDKTQWEQTWKRAKPRPVSTEPKPRKPVTSPTLKPIPKKAGDPVPASVTVYVTKTGSKYHLGSCSYLRSSRIAISLTDAKRSYSACSRCRPPD